MTLRPRTIPYLRGTRCSVPQCGRAAAFDVYVYDLHLHAADGVLEEIYVQDETCPFVCRRHMQENEANAVGDRSPSGLVVYPYTNRHRNPGYTKYVPIDNVYRPIAEKVAARSYRRGFSVEESFIAEEARTRVRKVLAALPQRDAEVLRAVFLDEQSADAVCRRFDVDQDFLRVLLGRAKERFRQEYLHYNAAVYPTELKTPQATALKTFDLMCASVNDELIEILSRKPELMRELQPRRFEEMIAELSQQRGCVVTLTPATRDGGADIYAVAHDAFGESLYVIECKRYSANRKVGVEPVRGLYAVTEAKRATRGILVTTSYFTNDAIAFASPLEYRLSLRDFDAVCDWLRGSGLGGAA